MRQICKLCIIPALAMGLLFQGCAVVPPARPIYRPPAPQPTHYPPAPQPRQPPVSAPVMVPSKPAETINVAANFSSQAKTLLNQGNLDQAASTLERGLRLAPKDAHLWSQLAEVRLQQKNYQQARALAAKSNSLAGSDKAVMQKNSWIISEADRRGGGN